jgi:hypothetical protein
MPRLSDRLRFVRVPLGQRAQRSFRRNHLLPASVATSVRIRTACVPDWLTDIATEAAFGAFVDRANGVPSEERKADDRMTNDTSIVQKSVRISPQFLGHFARSRRLRLDSAKTYGNPARRTACRNTVVFRRWQKPSEILRRLHSRPRFNGCHTSVEWHQLNARPGGHAIWSSRSNRESFERLVRPAPLGIP